MFSTNFIKEIISSQKSAIEIINPAAPPMMLEALKTCYNLFQAEYEDLSDQGKNARKQILEAITKATH